MSILMGISSALLASDVSGLYVRYDLLSGNDYRITVTELVPCEGQAPVSFPNLRFNTGCTIPVSLGNWQSLPSRTVQSLCPFVPTSCDQSPNSVGTNWQAYTYYRDYRFDPTCVEYTIGVRRLSRPLSVTNGTQGQPIYAYCTLKPGLAQHAPTLLFELGKHAHDSTDAFISLGLIDQDNDSLITTLFNPQDSAAMPIAMASGYSASDPLGPNYTASWDSQTGNLHFVAGSQAGAYESAIVAQVVEFKNGISHGTVFFEMPIKSISRPAVTNDQARLVTPQFLDSLSGGTWSDSFVVRTALNQDLTVMFQAIDNEGDSTQITHLTNLPNAEFYNILDDPTSRRDTVVDVDPLAVLNWKAIQGGAYSLGLTLTERPDPCGPNETRTYNLVIEVGDTCIWVAFPTDTIYACAGDSVSTSPTLSGNFQGPLEFLWDNASQDSVGLLTTPGVHWVEVRDTIQGCSMRDSVVIVWTDECVWPGDANFDGIANHYDLLPIGLSFNQTGPQRPNASTSWNASPAFTWNDTTPGAIDVAHADTDGNGVVDAMDTLAISQNYGLSHQKTGGQDSLGCLLYMQTQTQAVQVGDTLRIPIFLGTDSAVVDSAYGIAFSINYTQSLVDSGNVRYVIPDTSWLGSRQNLIYIQRDNYNFSIADLAISRTDQTNRMHYGRIAQVDIVIVDDIIGKKETDTLKLNFEDVRLVTANGTFVPVNAISSKVVIQNKKDVGLPPWLFSETRVYPNPAKASIFIDHPSAEAISVSIVDMQGRIVSQLEPQRGKFRVSLDQIPAGIYGLQLTSGQSTWTTRIINLP